MMGISGLHRGVLRRVQRRPAPYLLQQQRQLMPLIVGGLVVFVVGTAANYAYRAIKAMKEESEKEKAPDGERPSRAAPEKDDRKDTEQKASTSPKKRKVVLNGIGIDVGSTFARVAIQSGDAAEVLINKEGRRQTPVQLWVQASDEIVAGHVAKLQRFTKSSSISSTLHLCLGKDIGDLKSYPRRVSLEFPEPEENHVGELRFNVGGASLSPKDAYFHILKCLNESCSPSISTLRYNCVVATPTYFSALQNAQAVGAVRRTGVSEVQAVSDAQCAVVGATQSDFWPNDIKVPRLVVVVDVGGRYTQLSLTRQDASDEVPLLVDSTVVDEVGGDTFDKLLVSHLAKKFEATHGINLLSDSMAVQRLYDAVEGSKLELSNKFSSRINIPFITASAKGPIHLDETYYRADYDNVISSLVSKLSASLIKMLENAAEQQLSSKEGEKLSVGCLLVGGGGRVPLVKAEIQAAVNKVNTSKNLIDRKGEIVLVEPPVPEEQVATGAAAIVKMLQ